jgi:hypothetical protein
MPVAPLGSQYCAPLDLLTTGVNPFALQDVSSAQQLIACQQANAMADDYISSRWTMPLIQWPVSFVFYSACFGVWLCLKTRGMNPEAGADEYWKVEYDAAHEYFRNIQRTNLTPYGLIPGAASPGDPTHDLPQVISQPQRGWSTFSLRGRPSVW